MVRKGGLNIISLPKMNISYTNKGRIVNRVRTRLKKREDNANYKRYKALKR